MSPAETIRHLLRGGATINMPGVYDTLSSRLAAEAGFEVMFISGYSVSAARLGTPDFGYLTQPEIAEVARGVCSNSGGRPVIVDADTGYGNALNTIRTARMLHAAGAAGVFLEDQEWPKKCGHFAGKRVVDRADWLAKLRSVLRARPHSTPLLDRPIPSAPAGLRSQPRTCLRRADWVNPNHSSPVSKHMESRDSL